jgi:hypothetical protein
MTYQIVRRTWLIKIHVIYKCNTLISLEYLK